MRLLQINTTVNSGSTGRIAEDIGSLAIERGYESYIAFGRGNRSSKSNLIRIGSQIDMYWHGFQTLIFDRHGFASKAATEQLIRVIDELQPDVIGLHNLHGYYINIEVLFNYLKVSNIPVLWTLFDCWAFTGHCTYFDDISCTKWVNACNNCPKTKKYPSSLVFDNSANNFINKRSLFTGITNINFVVHSSWLHSLFLQSFLKEFPVHLIHSGVDIHLFSPRKDFSRIYARYPIEHKKIILGVASIWDPRKGLNDFKALSKQLPQEYLIVLIGISEKDRKDLPQNILAISRTENISELADWYSLAGVFVNPTWQDNFPTTNLEALSCGTPVITYNSGGSPEAIDSNTGFVVNKGQVNDLKDAILRIFGEDRAQIALKCRQRAVNMFNKEKQFGLYLDLFEKSMANMPK